MCIKLFLILPLFLQVISKDNLLFSDEDDKSGKVIRGRKATVGEFPYIVRIQGKLFRPTCTGVLLTEYNVFTVAHVFFNTTSTTPNSSLVEISINEFMVAAGTTTIYPYEDGYQLRFIENRTMHPQYLSGGFKYDLAVMRMNYPFVYSNLITHVSIFSLNAALVKQSWLDLAKEGDICLVPGWGVVVAKWNSATQRYDVQIPMVLRVAELVPITNPDCDKALCHKYNCAKFRSGLSILGCADPILDIKGHPCKGDSGAPIICNKHMYGIYSMSYECQDMDISPNPAIFNMIYGTLDFYRRHIDYGGLSTRLQINFIFIVLGCMLTLDGRE